MARNKASGKHNRTRLGLKVLFRKIPDNAIAEKWLQDWIWKGTPHCPRCGSTNVNMHARHPTMPHRCRECRRYFSVKTGTVMEASNVSCQDWVIAIYLYHSNLKGISSMRLHRELGVRQSTAWFILQRLRKAAESDLLLFSGVVEADEMFIGGKTERMNWKQYVSRVKKTDGGGGGATGKVPVAVIREKATGRIQMAVLPDTKGESVKSFVLARTVAGTEVHTDQFKGYLGLDKHCRKHETVNHKEGEYVRYEKTDCGGLKVITTNGCESVCGTFKASLVGVYHWVSAKHLPLHLNEMVGKRNSRELDMLERMGEHAAAMTGKKIRHEDLTARTPEEEEVYAARNYEKFGLQQACLEAAGLA